MTTFQGYLFAEETYTALEFDIFISKSNLNLLQDITQKRTHLCLKATGYHAKSISNSKGLYLTFPFNKIIKFVQRYSFNL